MARWLAILTMLAACGSSGAPPAPPPAALVLQRIQPSCPVPGGIFSLVLGGGDARACDAGKIFAGSVELTNLGVVSTEPLTIAARLPAGVGLVRGEEVRIVCGERAASLRWLELCPEGRPDGGGDAAPAELPSACGVPVAAVIEVVDKYGAPFPREAGGIYLVPIDADDFAFDSGKSQHLSGTEVLYTFSSDCFPRATVKAPVLGGFGTQGLWIGKRCQFGVEIADLGCHEARVGQAQETFQVVPPP